MVAFLSGLLAGLLHVISGPDHVAAVAPLAVRRPRAGRVLGALWGVGHGSGVLLWLGVAFLFQRSFGRELRSEALEVLVGIALVALGSATLMRSRSAVGEHTHDHGQRGNGAALAMGALHGSAGASHLLALLPTLGLPGNGALTYAGGYLLAGVLAMASVGTLIGRYVSKLGDPQKLQRLCALAVIAIGMVWLITSIHELA